jgi:hypothetical protein
MLTRVSKATLQAMFVKGVTTKSFINIIFNNINKLKKLVFLTDHNSLLYLLTSNKYLFLLVSTKISIIDLVSIGQYFGIALVLNGKN